MYLPLEVAADWADTKIGTRKMKTITLKNLLQFNEDFVFNNYNENHNGGKFIAYNNTDIKQIENLYKQLLVEKDKIISMLEAKVSQ